MSGLLLGDLNTREFEVLASDVMEEFTKLTVKPVYKVLGPKVKGKMKQLVATLETVDASKLRDKLAKGPTSVKVDGSRVTLNPGDLEFEESTPDHLSMADSKLGRVFVDVTRTKELEAEGLIRDVTRRVQVMRKELDLKVEQNIELVVQLSEPESVDLVKMQENYLMTETRAVSLELVGPKARPKWKSMKYAKEWEVDDLTLKVGMTPV